MATITREPVMTQEQTDTWVSGLHEQLDEHESGAGYPARCYIDGSLLPQRADPEVPVHCERHPMNEPMWLTPEIRLAYAYVLRRARTVTGNDAAALHEWARTEDIAEFAGTTRPELHDAIHYLARWRMLPAKATARPVTLFGAKPVRS